MCYLDEGLGSEQSKSRPVVIIQNNLGNIHSPTTIVAMTTSAQKGNYPMHVSVEKGKGGLTEDSEILFEQIRTVDKTRLIRRMGTLQFDKELMKEINKAIEISLGL